LFDRTNKKVALTSEGQVFYERVQSLLGMVSDIAQEMRDFSDPNRDAIRLGVPVQIGTYFFPKIFIEFAALYPKLQLDVVEEGSAVIVRMVEKGELDI